MSRFNLYLLDSSVEEDRRDWNNMLPAVPVDVRFVPPRLEPEPGPPALIVVHRSSAHGSVRPMAEKYPDFKFVVVSGGEDQPPETSIANVYYRKTFVGENDKAFQRCFQRFWDTLQTTGTAVWKLLEPDPWPQSLTAVYILLKTLENADDEAKGKIQEGWNAMATDWKEQLCRAAWREYFEEWKGNLVSWKESNLPCFDETGSLASGDINLSGTDTGRAISAMRIVLEKFEK